jgi:hypothetical protein
VCVARGLMCGVCSIISLVRSATRSLLLGSLVCMSMCVSRSLSVYNPLLDKDKTLLLCSVPSLSPAQCVCVLLGVWLIRILIRECGKVKDLVSVVRSRALHACASLPSLLGPSLTSLGEFSVPSVFLLSSTDVISAPYAMVVRRLRRDFRLFRSSLFSSLFHDLRPFVFYCCAMTHYLMHGFECGLSDDRAVLELRSRRFRHLGPHVQAIGGGAEEVGS